MTALYTLAALSLATSLAWPGLCLVFWPVHVANDNWHLTNPDAEEGT